MVKGKWQIIIRTFCERNYLLTEALYSIVMQPYENKEVVIVYHYTDKTKLQETKELVSRFKSYFGVSEYEYKKQKDTLRGTIMNDVLDKLDGEYLSFLDDDDIYYPEFTDLLHELKSNSSLNFVYGNSLTVQVKKYDSFNFSETKYKGHGEEFSKLKLFMDNFIPINTFVLRRGIVDQTRFDTTIDVLEDWLFLAELAMKKGFEAKYVDVAVSEYRKFQNNANTGYVPANYDYWQKCRDYVLAKIYAAKHFDFSGDDLRIFAKEYYHLRARHSNFTTWENSKAFKAINKLRSSKVVDGTMKKLSPAVFGLFRKLTK